MSKKKTFLNNILNRQRFRESALVYVHNINKKNDDHLLFSKTFRTGFLDYPSPLEMRTFLLQRRNLIDWYSSG